MDISNDKIGKTPTNINKYDATINNDMKSHIIIRWTAVTIALEIPMINSLFLVVNMQIIARTNIITPLILKLNILVNMLI